MMPFLPIVRVPDFEAGVAAAVQAEHGYRHTAIVHTRNVEHATGMARAMKHDAVRAERAVDRRAGRERPGLLQPHNRHTDR